METLSCFRCGAPLPLPKGMETVVVCPYCKTETHAPRNRRRYVPPASNTASRSLMGVSVALGLGVLLVAGGFYLSTGGGLFGEWYGYGGSRTALCFATVNDDDTPDLIGFIGSPSAQRHVTAVDGRTGARLWQTEDFPQEAQLFCAAPTHVLLSRPGFQITAFAVKTGEPSWQARLSDEPSLVATGDGCVAFRNRDQQTQGLQLADGAASDCPSGVANLPASIWPDPVGSAQAGDVTARLTARKSGTPVLTLSVYQNDNLRWEKTLPLQQQGNFVRAPLVTIVDDVVIVAGTDLERPAYLISMGFSLADGAERFVRRESSHWSGNVMNFGASGGMYYIGWGFGMHAYSPQTGELIWHIGGR